MVCCGAFWSQNFDSGKYHATIVPEIIHSLTLNPGFCVSRFLVGLCRHHQVIYCSLSLSIRNDFANCCVAEKSVTIFKYATQELTSKWWVALLPTLVYSYRHIFCSHSRVSQIFVPPAFHLNRPLDPSSTSFGENCEMELKLRKFQPLLFGLMEQPR